MAELHGPPGTELIMRTYKHKIWSLLPQPSCSSSDPLNWSKSWKCASQMSGNSLDDMQFLFLFVSVESALSMGPMFPLFEAEFHLDNTQLSLLTGACVMALGFSNFIIVPCSNILGRRFTSLLFCLLGIASCIWQALAISHSSLLAARVVNGIATATSETLMVQVIADIFFLHQRGFWTGGQSFQEVSDKSKQNEALCLWKIKSLLKRFVPSGMAGAAFFWLSLAMSIFNFLTLLFCFPETKFNRDSVIQTGVSEEATDNTSQDMDSNSAKAESHQLENIGGEVHNAVGTGRPSWDQFKLWHAPDANWKRFLLRDLFSPCRLFFFPIILWAALNVAGPANVLLFWNLTESAVLGAPPYSFSPASVGYSNFAFVVGGLIGLATAGPFSDYIAIRLTAHNRGVREAEMRLLALIPYFVTTVIGITIGGVGYARLWEWPIILVIGYGFSGLCVTAVPTVAVAYAVECYKSVAGEIMVVATVIKNTCGFAMSFWVPSLAERNGYLAPAMVELALTIGPLVMGLPIYLYGKKLRKLTQGSSVHLYES
ncbi:hypothetical protein N7510_008250 [Penicillium lagena]|uniref:uncharacterized protein n=1 Tax=Penicillium lagena TaxID=94218 RepID=UPI00253F9B21|nr:uncharacterized protein N7510_008250 [Penicillium lagena]KAJ5605469.1 hypothetical protein N7510_008250 [Penicillium lagena]